MLSVASLAHERFGPVSVCQPWREKIIGYLPQSMQSGVVAAYLRIENDRGYVEANRALYRIRRAVVDPDVLKCGDFRLTNDEDALRDWAESRAAGVERAESRAGTEVAMAKAVGWCEFYDFDPLESNDLFGMLARYKDAKWWKRQMRVKQARVIDQLGRDLGLVNKRRQIYLTDEAYSIKRLARKRNRLLLERLEAENQHGQTFTLAELADKSISKPEIRRTELMVRLRGFEEVADQLGHVADFITITCPSKYHSSLINGAQNPKYQGFTPRQANDYLCSVFDSVRKALGRDGVRIYGFRIVEPHHDGCPHWHLLLFMRQSDLMHVRKTISRFALAVDGNEPGARQRRVTFERINKEKGSAVGYVAKYVAKNIDGLNVELDSYGEDAIRSAKRIVEWASVWGLRQFQQVGGPEVGPWREMRRVTEEKLQEWSQVLRTCGELVPELAEKVRQAADSANWAAYVLLQGGPMLPRKDRPIKLLMMTAPETDPLRRVDRSTGEYRTEKHGVYGDLLKRVKGVLVQGVIVVSRWYTWTVKPVRAGFEGLSGASAPPWTRVNNCPVVATG
ncbi:MAG: replication endonuclease [Marinospirillum sp.]|uniref:replication endonuclease n=1 Tax=Marinospirillum sp. TaxID=2183934 RepID=UPI0019E22F4C|nr:replication endonuclease [Marinospirillum sp.]MBE0507795.1 replication endonuclease [Marinospirillum sp.]